MSLADRIVDPPRRPRPQQKVCDVQRALLDLSQEDGDALRVLLYRRRDLTNREITDIFDEENVAVGYDTVRRHRAGVCASCKQKGLDTWDSLTASTA